MLIDYQATHRAISPTRSASTANKGKTPELAGPIKENGF